jgi:hypothetical protein
VAFHFDFRATNLQVTRPAADNLVPSGGSILFTSGPTRETIGDAENRVTFTVTGTAPNGDFSGTLLMIRTRHRFHITPTEAGRLTASAFFTPAFLFTLACAGEGPIWEFFDKAGPASVALFTRMDVRVTALNGTIVLNDIGAFHNRFSDSLSGLSVPNSSTGGFAPELMEIVETRSFATDVNLTDTVRIDARYVFQAFANDLSTFVVNADGDGLGLNVPFAFMRTDP